ncbi:type II toxin-antitoxin system PemK/MazF family toxin [Arthrobacter sp. MI7-26]|uniref:type II toxin-antitoxin system PemK/MazF family toxin n=1 Tax=Arthrobacter sp. MI7-26 TaxID=2993653 RepID=UPI002249A02A|nr:type II toxin-antitoxin system PemK/MazF family toxin [Arthrobacter sp. MI7-26]MCX2747237.1 type II toxin-antitoxin system PemK/MazF family toxin [Arthrobacter sp. MI7-26]
MIRGEIWTVAGGVFASKPRPALVIQDDRFSDSESLTVLPMTSTLRDAPLLRIPVTPSDLSGLVRESHIMIDKITTVRRSNVQSRVGRLTAGQLVDVERALLVFLGIA